MSSCSIPVSRISFVDNCLKFASPTLEVSGLLFITESWSRWGETAELEGREPIINTLPHLLWHPNEIGQNEPFWPEECRKRVRSYHSTRPWGSMKSQTLRVRSHDGKDTVCNSLYGKMWYGTRWSETLSTPGSPIYILHVAPSVSSTPVFWSAHEAQSISVIPVSPYTHSSSVLCQAESRGWWEVDFPTTTPPWPFVQSTPLLFHITVYPDLKEHKTNINPKERHKRRPKGKS